MRTTGSILRFRLGDARDFDRPASPGDTHVHVIAIGSDAGRVMDEPPFIPRYDGPHPVIWIELDDETVGCVGGSWPDTEELLAMFVDYAQEQLDEEIWGGWPFCPEHGSHLDCDLRDGIAVWLCPRGETVSRVGDLSA
jgi:hypothetical protein